MSTLATLANPAVVDAQVGMLIEYFSAEIEPHVRRIYVDALRDIPEESLRAGCRRVIASARFMPKVAEIRAAVDAERRDRRLLEEPQRDIPPDQRFCHTCQDTGWMGEGLHVPVAPGIHPVVRRCACYATNPELARQRGPAKYDQSEH